MISLRKFLLSFILNLYTYKYINNYQYYYWTTFLKNLKLENFFFINFLKELRFINLTKLIYGVTSRWNLEYQMFKIRIFLFKTLDYNFLFLWFVNFRNSIYNFNLRSFFLNRLNVSFLPTLRYFKRYYYYCCSFFNGTVKYYKVVYYDLNNFFFYHKTIVRKNSFKRNYYLKNIRLSCFFFYNYFLNFKTVLLPLLISSLLVIILIDYFYLDIVTYGGIWVIVGFLFFWLMSGFNFFIKRYRFGKFTSAIQRFWKRTNTYFWLIEGFLFSLFFYYYLNSSQEPLYMFDEGSLNQTHLTNLIAVYFSFVLIVFMIFYSYYTLLNLNNFCFKQKLLHLTVSTVGLLFVFLLESYQFYYIITLFFENIWYYSSADNLWILNYESPRIRVKQQYLLLALIAKYWHFLFIFFSWIFLIIKVYEQKRIYYPLFGLNLQNFLILFGLNLLFNLVWVKWIIRRFYDVVYYWFFIDSNNWLFLTFNYEIFNFFTN